MLKVNISFLNLRSLFSLFRLKVSTIHEFKDALRSHHRRLKNRVILHDINQGIEKLIDILDKGIHDTRSYSSYLPAQAKISQNKSISQDFQQGHSWTQKETVHIQIAIAKV